LRLCDGAYPLAGLTFLPTPAQITTAFFAQIIRGAVARAAEGAVDVGSCFGHADQRFIFDKVEAFFIDLQEFNILRLRRTAAGAAFDRAWVLGVAKGTLPDQGDKTKGFSGHLSSRGDLR
jgi:hypothetical protein